AMPQLAGLISRASEIASWPAGTPELPGPRDAMLRRVLNANFRVGTAASATALAQFANSASEPEAFRAEALAYLSEWPKSSGRDRITGLWRPLPSRDANIAGKVLQLVISTLLHNSSTPIKSAAARAA